MTPMVHLLLLPLLFSIACGKDLEERKGPFQDIKLDVPEGTPVPYAIHQFQVNRPEVNNFKLSGDENDAIKISNDGWLYLERPLDWSQEKGYLVTVEALADGEVVDAPITVTIKVLDVNNNAPVFNQSEYTATVRENTRAGVPFIQVTASDKDEPDTLNSQLRYSIVGQIPSKHKIPLFQIDNSTGEISTTEEGQRLLKAREALKYTSGEKQNAESLKVKFDEYCPQTAVPHNSNPFFTCVERAETRRWNRKALEDPDYTLLVRVQDLDGASPTALSGNTRVYIVVQQNLWVNPGPITIVEHSKETYPLVIAKVESNDPNATYRLVQKERWLRFPFQITDTGEIYLTEELDREIKDHYILVVMAKDHMENDVDPPMEIYVWVQDINDNKPTCENEESVFEVQEDEPIGSTVGILKASDSDAQGTLNSQLAYEIAPQDPPVFSIDGTTGSIQSLRLLQRKQQAVYKLNVKVSDAGFTTECKVVIKVIDVNNELPLFEKSDYGSFTFSEDTPAGTTVLTLTATDADDPESGSSKIDFHISSGNEDEVFSIDTDGSGVGHLIINQPLNFESSSAYKLQIDARNPEPLKKGLEYGPESTAVVSVFVNDIDEDPEFSPDVLYANVPENTTIGSVLMTVRAKDPEGKNISFKLEGDTLGWLEIDAATGEIKTKAKLDREKLEDIEFTVTAFEKANPDKSSKRVVHVKLLDVNDNYPKLTVTQAFVCLKKPEPLIITAEDPDSSPFSQPFTFIMQKKLSPWELRKIDATSAKLTLRKAVPEAKTFNLGIIIKDNAGLGVTQSIEVKVCECTELGYCYTAPEAQSSKLGLGGTIGILAATLGFCIIAFIVAIKRSNRKKKALNTEEERNAMM